MTWLIAVIASSARPIRIAEVSVWRGALTDKQSSLCLWCRLKLNAILQHPAEMDRRASLAMTVN